MKSKNNKNTVSLELPIELSLVDYLQLFNKFSKKQRIEIANKISESTFEDRWQLLKKKMPSSRISEQDVIDEVKKFRKARYGKH